MYNKKKLNGYIAIALLTSGFVVMPEVLGLHPMLIVQAQIKMYTGVAEDYPSPIESQDIAKLRARDKAIRQAREQAGVALKSYSQTVNTTLSDDEISAITSTTYQIVGEPVYEHIVQQVTDTSTVIIWKATVNVKVDDAEVKNWLKLKINEQAKIVSSNNALNAAVKENDKKIEDLRNLAKNVTSDKETDLKNAFAQADKEYLYNQKIEEINRLEAKGKYEEAISASTEAIKLNPQNPLGYYHRGNEYSSMAMYYYFQLKSTGNTDKDKQIGLQNYELANKDFEKAVTLKPDYAEAYAARAMNYYIFEKYDQAVNDWEKAISIDNDRWSYECRALYYHQVLQDDNKALADCNNAIVFHPNDPMAYITRGNCYEWMERYDKALADYLQAIKLDPNSVSGYESIGSLYQEINNYEKAIEYFNKCIQLEPNEWLYYNNRGDAYEENGKYDKALEDYDKVIQLAPEEEYGYYSKGWLYLQYLHNYNLAIENFNRVIAINPGDSLAYSNRGDAQYALGKLENALQSYRKVLELDPDNITVQHKCRDIEKELNAGNNADSKNVSENYIEEGNSFYNQGEYDKAIEMYNKAIELRPTSSAIYNNRGNAYHSKGNLTKAIGDFNKAIEINPNNAVAYFNRGNSYDELGKIDQSIGDYSKAIEIKPDYASAYNNRGNLYFKKGNYDKAITDYSAAIGLDQNYAYAYNNRGNAYYNQGKYTQAIADFEKTLQLNPNHKTAKQMLEKAKAKLS